MQKILDLSESNQPDSFLKIDYKISSFPDGQQSITIDLPTASSATSVLIKSRLNSFKDLELIICANQSLREMGFTDISLFVPYFLGARSDRKFSKGTCNYLKSVICPIVNSQHFKKVTVMDPHSDVLEACLENFEKVSNSSLIKFALDDIGATDVTLISPDAGALKKIFTVAEEFGIQKVITAEKVRDLETGKILYTNVPGISFREILKKQRYQSTPRSLQRCLENLR